jgi:DNA-binding MarR family transcriptional regulator
MPIEEDILRSLRRITRAIELHSRKLSNTFGLTGPQLVCLRAIGQQGRVTPSALAIEVALSNATVSGIIDRLAARQLVSRERSSRDRRLVEVSLTPAGEALINQAPSPLQEQFADRLARLPEVDRQRISDTLKEIVRMMDSEAIEAAPILSTSPAQSAEEVEQILSEDEQQLEPMTDELALAVDGERGKDQ